MADEASTASTETEEAASGKEAIYIMIGDHVKDKTGKRIGKTGGREIFDMVVNQVFALAVQEGTLRLNGGFGSFHVRDYGSGSRKLPSGQEVAFGERQKLRYEEGVVVKELVKNGGKLEEAIRDGRGSRAQTEEAAPATAAKTPAKPKPTAAKPAAAEEEVSLD